MAEVTNNVQLALVDGTVCAAFFTKDAGVTISKNGQPCGSIGEAEVSEFAGRKNGAMELAAQVETILGQPALTTESQNSLMDSAYRWFEQHF